MKKPVCAGCGKPADPIVDATTQQGVFLHDACSRAMTSAEGWNQIVRAKEEPK